MVGHFIISLNFLLLLGVSKFVGRVLELVFLSYLCWNDHCGNVSCYLVESCHLILITVLAACFIQFGWL